MEQDQKLTLIELSIFLKKVFEYLYNSLICIIFQITLFVQ